jgi:hypothetical protein
VHIASIAKASTMNYIFAICVLILVPIVQPNISFPHQQLMLNLFHSEMVQMVDTKIGGTRCASDLETFFTDLLDMKLWALQSKLFLQIGDFFIFINFSV